MDICLILRILGDFSDEEEEQWEEVEPSEDVQTNVRTECVVNDHMSFLSTIGHNSDKLSHPRTYKRRYGRMVLIIMLVIAVQLEVT